MTSVLRVANLGALVMLYAVIIQSSGLFFIGLGVLIAAIACRHCGK